MYSIKKNSHNLVMISSTFLPFLLSRSLKGLVSCDIQTAGGAEVKASFQKANSPKGLSLYGF